MKGSIRFILGLLIVLASVGASDDTATTYIISGAAIGLLLMWSGSVALRKD
jgi:hypothetical protein